MAYYTGPTGNSIATKSKVRSNAIGAIGVGDTTNRSTTNPTLKNVVIRQHTSTPSGSNGTNANGYNYDSYYDDQGYPHSSPVNTNNHSSSPSSSSSSSSGHSSSSGATYTEQAAPSYSYSWNGSDLIDDYMKLLNARAESAYNRNIGVLNDLYDDAAGRLRSNYKDSVGVLNTNRDNNTSAINADAEEAMRQAYINNMLSRKSLQQAMTAQGLNGGATETTRANMENNYGEARNAIDTTRNKNLAELLGQYQSNLAGLNQQLNSGLSDLDSQRMNYAMQMQSQLQNTLDSYADKLYDTITDYQDWYNSEAASATPEERMARTMGLIEFERGIQNWANNIDNYNLNGAANLSNGANEYLNNLNNIAANSSNYSLTPAQAINSYDPVSIQQAGIQAAASNYQKALAAQEALGATTPQARNTALSQYGNISSLQEILRQLGYM